MKVGIPKERRAGESRVAGSPEMVKKLVALGLDVAVEAGAGIGANIMDEAFADAGAKIVKDAAALYGDADIVLKVQRPLGPGDEIDEIAMMKKGAILVALLNPFGDRAMAKAYAAHGLTAFAMEFIPRISRAQAMDALSSQSNIAGYKAVIDAAAAFKRVMPMMMTAAGTVPPARALILGAGVAGLQAIATARRLGAIVSAFDVRAAVKEEVQSLGATFIEVESEETGEAEGGYAKEMTEDYKRRQAELIAKTLAKTDIAITTALIPGRPAPRLITEDMLKGMKPGSVIFDMAVESGGNCEFSEPGKTVDKYGVTILGPINLPAHSAAATSPLYARNLLNFLALLVDKESGNLSVDWDDEIVKGALLTRDGEVVHTALADA